MANDTGRLETASDRSNGARETGKVGSGASAKHVAAKTTNGIIFVMITHEYYCYLTTIESPGAFSARRNCDDSSAQSEMRNSSIRPP